MKQSMTNRFLLALALCAVGAVCAPASGLAAGSVNQGPVPATPVNVALQGLYSIHGQEVTVPHRAVTVSGTVARFVPRQRLLLVASVGAHVFRREILSIADRGARGHFQTMLRAPQPGHITVRLYHARDSELLSFERWVSYTVLDNQVQLQPGASGRLVQLVQERLAALHLYIPQTGVYDQGTELALDAYHRLLGRGEGHTSLDPPTLTDLLDGIGSFHVRYPQQGHHAEGDLSDQVLALTDGPKVHWLFPISSG